MIVSYYNNKEYYNQKNINAIIQKKYKRNYKKLNHFQKKAKVTKHNNGITNFHIKILF